MLYSVQGHGCVVRGPRSCAVYGSEHFLIYTELNVLLGEGGMIQSKAHSHCILVP